MYLYILYDIFREERSNRKRYIKRSPTKLQSYTFKGYDSLDSYKRIYQKRKRKYDQFIYKETQKKVKNQSSVTKLWKP